MTRYLKRVNPISAAFGDAALRRFQRIAVAATVLLLLASCTNRADEADDGLTSSLGPAARDAVFRTLDGRQLRAADLGGPVLVNFWATSCAVCLDEAPDLVALRDRLAPSGYEMISVAMPYDRPDAVLELTRANGWQHPVAIDLDGSVLAAFEPVPGTPTNLLLAADGTLAGRWVGRTDVHELEAAIEGLLENDSRRSAANAVPVAGSVQDPVDEFADERTEPPAG